MMRRALAALRDVAHTMAVMASAVWWFMPPPAEPVNQALRQANREYVKLVESIDREALRAAREAAVRAAERADTARRLSLFWACVSGAIAGAHLALWLAS